jgi:hypothetical protein
MDHCHWKIVLLKNNFPNFFFAKNKFEMKNVILIYTENRRMYDKFVWSKRHYSRWQITQ